MKNERVRQLMELKKSQLKTEEDQQKYQLIIELLAEKDCFFKMDMETAFGILEFLGVTEEEALSLYMELTSPKVYQEVKSQERVIINPKL